MNKWVWLYLSLHAGFCNATTALTATVSNAKVPAGGTVQIQITLTSPQPLTLVKMKLDLDGAVFGEIVNVDAFSATGDQIGVATVALRSLVLTISSPLAGLGRLPGLPIVVLTATVLPNAPVGTATPVSFHDGAGRDLDNVDYSISAIPGTVTVGGALSVSAVTTVGSQVKVEGTGFSESTAVSIDGVSVAATQLVTSQELSITLAAPADLTGKRLLVADDQAGQVEVYPSFHVAGSPFVFPQQTYSAVSLSDLFSTESVVALENPTPQPVDVIFRARGFGHLLGGSCSATIPPLAVYVQHLYRTCGIQGDFVAVVAGAPVRLVYILDSTQSGQLLLPRPTPGQPPTTVSLLLSGVPVSAVSWEWQTATPAPAPVSLYLRTQDLNVPVRITASTDSGGNWMVLSTTRADTCTSLACPDSSQFTVSANIAGLAPGIYRGSISVLPESPYAQTTTLPVQLTVNSTAPTLANRDAFAVSGMTSPPLPEQGPPLITAVLNAASMTTSALAPGEIVTLLGQNIGSDVPDLDGARVLFDGVPATLLYAFSTQLNAVVPDEVGGRTVMSIQVEAKGAAASVGGVPVAPSAPGIFTLSGSGAGPGAIRNQDGSVNDAGHPAPRGSIVQIFATGGQPDLPVHVSIGGADATVTFAGSAPQAVAGLFQVNAVVPVSAATGPAVPVILTIGSARSPNGPTLAVQ